MYISYSSTHRVLSMWLGFVYFRLDWLVTPADGSCETTIRNREAFLWGGGRSNCLSGVVRLIRSWVCWFRFVRMHSIFDRKKEKRDRDGTDIEIERDGEIVCQYRLVKIIWILFANKVVVVWFCVEWVRVPIKYRIMVYIHEWGGGRVYLSVLFCVWFRFRGIFQSHYTLNTLETIVRRDMRCVFLVYICI